MIEYFMMFPRYVKDVVSGDLGAASNYAWGIFHTLIGVYLLVVNHCCEFATI